MFWKNAGWLRIHQVNLRETVLDISGQEIMTSDNVTLRLNAQAVYRVTDPHQAVKGVENLGQALYREVQVVLRTIIGTCTLDALLNQVIQARKAAEANLIVPREETAAMRSQANTARLLVSNPTLVRLRELEVPEKVVGSSKLNVVLGEKGLAERGGQSRLTAVCWGGQIQ